MVISKFNRKGGWAERRLPILLALLVGLSAFTLAFSSQPPVAVAADDPSFASEAFRTTWERTDLPIATGKAARSWYWGPKPLSFGLQETYADSPGQKRQVQYFDKARMEINDPSKGAVTNGLLVVELINGRRQEGNNLFIDGGPAGIALAGDADNQWPTYAGLGGVYLRNKDMKPGQLATMSWNAEGQGVQDAFKSDPATAIVVQQNNLGIPDAFWSFVNRKGPIYQGADLVDDTISDWLFSAGLPVTEAYWTKVRVGGKDKDVLFQAFERRVLTYTPSNPAEYRVEMGNVGWHYLNWRYPQGVNAPPPPVVKPPLPAVSDPLARTFLDSKAEWYEVTGDSLNIRTAPNTDAPIAERSSSRPFLQRLIKGNRIQPIRTVKGEAIEEGNDNWFQIYEKPDLFVYAGYTRKFTLPDYPTPQRTHKGLWVSINLTKQMMAVFDGTRLLYKTMIASGIPNDDPEKDNRTPAGVFKVNGSYRPVSQTMSGGTGDKASGGDYYKLEDVRNVSYFFEDYAIHGSYWHARFGTFPQSHGCVNATVYDAGLIYKLKAGTTVDVFRNTGSSLASRSDW